MSEPGQWFEHDPQWFKTAVFYEIHTRAFFDGNDDGSGDFRGLQQKLDYLQWLGIDCIWLLPFYPSPLRDGGYDIADFYGINADYGTVEDFRAFVQAAHEHGIRVIVDLVMNHTSSEHPWFQESRSNPEGPKGDWYVWSDTPERYQDARIIFIDTETSNWTWDPVRGQYYWHRFFSHQPDLNYENPRCGRRCSTSCASGSRSGWTASGSTRSRTSSRRRGRTARTCPETHEYLKRVRSGGGRALRRSRPPRRGEPVARRRRPVLRRGRRRRVPHGLPLPGHAAHVHGAAAGGGAADDRDPRQHAGDPGERAVGPLPAQPRRADARDGHRRGARLHVRRVREGPADEAQRRHPPPARAAPRRRPRRDRADARDPLLAAGFTRAVLRGRDRHGRQRLPRRPRRSPDADAVDERPERRLLARGLRAALPPAADGSRLRLPGGQRRGAAAHGDLAPALGAPLHRAAQGASRVRARATTTCCGPRT